MSVCVSSSMRFDASPNTSSNRAPAVWNGRPVFVLFSFTMGPPCEPQNLSSTEIMGWMAAMVNWQGRYPGGRDQLPVASCQLPVASIQHSAFSIQPSTVSYQNRRIVILSGGGAGFAPPESKDPYRERSFAIRHPTS